MDNSYKFFQNKQCRYFPCKKSDTLNCLFCFCPLYEYKNCGGKFMVLKKKMEKDSKLY